MSTAYSAYNNNNSLPLTDINFTAGSDVNGSENGVLDPWTLTEDGHQVVGYAQDYSTAQLLSTRPLQYYSNAQRITKHETGMDCVQINPNFLSPRPHSANPQQPGGCQFSPQLQPSLPMRSISQPAHLCANPYQQTYSPQSAYAIASPATTLFASNTPQSSPLQAQFSENTDHHREMSFTYYNSGPLATRDSEQYLSRPLVGLGHVNSTPTIDITTSQTSVDYYAATPLVSPPITPMESNYTHTHSYSPQTQNHSGQTLDGSIPTNVYIPILQPAPRTINRHRSAQNMRVNPLQPSLSRMSHMLNRSQSYSMINAPSTPATTASSSESPPSVHNNSLRNLPGGRPIYSKWSAAEDAALRAAISIHGTSKWSLVAGLVPGRTAMQCSTRWQGALNTNIHKGKWEIEEDQILIAAVKKWRIEHPSHSADANDSIPWGVIAHMLPRRRTGIQCQARWSEALDPSVRKGKWTEEEDEMLFKGVEEFGKCWIKVAGVVKGRTQRQIRTRWMQIRGRGGRGRRNSG